VTLPEAATLSDDDIALVSQEVVVVRDKARGEGGGRVGWPSVPSVSLLV